jgi:tetratricopeptide (TPR) repeat protein
MYPTTTVWSLLIGLGHRCGGIGMKEDRSKAPLSAAEPPDEVPVAQPVAEPAGQGTTVVEPPAEPTTGTAAAEPPVESTPEAPAASEVPQGTESTAADSPAGPAAPPVARLPEFSVAHPTAAASPWARPAGPEEQVEWVDPTPTDPILRIPPTPPEPKSTAAAVLLNLTGVGAGYFYLHRRWQAWTATVLAVAFVVVAFATNAAANPWLWRILAVVWLAVLVLDARRIAVKHPPIANRRPVVAGLVAVIAVVGAYIGYGVLGRAAYDDGLAAQSRGECAVATDRFKAVTGPYELTLSAASRGLAECADFTRAADSGDEAAAVQRYGQFRRDHPDSPLGPIVRHRLVETYTAWARRLRDEGQLADSIKVYRDLLAEDKSFAPEAADAYLRLAKKLTSVVPVNASEAAGALEAIADEFGDTPSAKEVPAAFDALYVAATAPLAAGRPCEVVDVLGFFAGLTNKAAEKVAGEAKNQYPRAMLDCGLNELRDGEAEAAVRTLNRFISTFPSHGDLPQAKSAQIAAQVAVGTGARVPVPAPLGTGGPITITFYNTVNSSINIKLAGSTAHEFTLPPCTTCPEAHAPGTGEESCNTPIGRPLFAVGLGGGTHHLLAAYEDNDELVKQFDVSAGGFDWYCLYAERNS